MKHCDSTGFCLYRMSVADACEHCTHGTEDKPKKKQEDKEPLGYEAADINDIPMRLRKE